MIASEVSLESVLNNGEQYTKDGKRTVLKADIVYQSNSNHLYKTDSLGRIVTVEGKLELGSGKRNEYAQK
ncbi:MAG: hypothetical protein ACC608_00675 [Anaerofustis sp.]